MWMVWIIWSIMVAHLSKNDMMNKIQETRPSYNDPQTSDTGKCRQFWAAVSKGDFAKVYRLDPYARISFIKNGVPSGMFTQLARSMVTPNERLTNLMGLSNSTMKRNVRNDAVLSVDAGERLVGLLKLIGQVATIVEESGNPDGFDPATWFATWISAPAAVLGGRKPEEFLDTAEGRETLGRLLAQMQSGAYA